MLWRKHLRSPSSPGLTSSIPETEHHLAKMDSFASEPLKDKDAGASATLESVQPLSTPDQDNNKTQTADVPKQAQSSATTDDNAKDSTQDRAERRALARKQALRTLPHVLVLLTCVSYLLFQFLGLDLGLRLISGYTEPRINRAEVQLQAALSDLARESIVHHKLDTVLSSALQPQYQETYEHCLARGLFKADEMFLGVDFTPYPDARNQTMDWVMDNCDRLHYAPQAFVPHASKVLAMVATVRKSAEEAFALLKYRALLLRSKIRGVDLSLAAKQALRLSTTRYGTPTNMPLGFSLDCEGLSRCRLIFLGTSFSSTDKKKSFEAVDRASKELLRWTYPFDKLLDISSSIVKFLFTLQVTLVGNIMGTMLFCYRAKPRPTSAEEAPKAARPKTALRNLIASLKRDEKLALGLIVNTFAYTLLHFQVTSISSEFDRLLLPVGLGFCAFHIPQAITFFNPVPWKAINAPEDVYSFCRAVQDLCLIAQDHAAESLLDTEEVKECCPLRRMLSTHSNAKPASKIGARFISPMTSISEDLQQERKNLHAELGKAVHEDGEDLSGYATETTDEEYDSDVQHASYVDLTGGATPTVSEGEEGEDWAVVED